MSLRCDCGYSLELTDQQRIQHAGEQVKCPQCGLTKRLPFVQLPPDGDSVSRSLVAWLISRLTVPTTGIAAVLVGLLFLAFYFTDSTRGDKRKLAAVEVRSPNEPPVNVLEAVLPHVGEQTRGDELVTQWLRENLDHPEWQAVKWWPSRDIQYVGGFDAAGQEQIIILRLSRLKFRSKNRIGADTLFDFVFEYADGKVDRVHSGRFAEYADLVESEKRKAVSNMAELFRVTKTKEWLERGNPKAKK